MNLAKNRVIFTASVICLILITAIITIFWARGFKPNLKTGTIERTGLIVANSIPTGASVFLDDRLTSATDTTITFLEPKNYKVRVEKDGYTNWQKEVEVREDLATEINALLFPTAPEIKPLTTTGAVNPTLSPDGTMIVYGVEGERGAVYILPMAVTTFPFRQDTRLLAQNTPSFEYSQARFVWGPDSKEIIARFQDEKEKDRANLLLNAGESNQSPRDITASLQATLTSWQNQLETKTQTLALPVPDKIKSATSEAALAKLSINPPAVIDLDIDSVSPLNYYPTGLVFSPDEQKILYVDQSNRYKVYDLKEEKEFTLPEFANFVNFSWYPDSNHLVVAQENLISIIEVDGANNMTVYSGKYENGFVFAHPSGTRLIILTTLTQSEGTAANLYSVNLR